MGYEPLHPGISTSCSRFPKTLLKRCSKTTKNFVALFVYLMQKYNKSQSTFVQFCGVTSVAK